MMKITTQIEWNNFKNSIKVFYTNFRNRKKIKELSKKFKQSSEYIKLKERIFLSHKDNRWTGWSYDRMRITGWSKSEISIAFYVLAKEGFSDLYQQVDLVQEGITPETYLCMRYEI